MKDAASRVQKKVQCTRAIKAAEALLRGAEPKIVFEYGKVCCKVAAFDDVIGATESDHLPIICLTNQTPSIEQQEQRTDEIR